MKKPAPLADQSADLAASEAATEAAPIEAKSAPAALPAPAAPAAEEAPAEVMPALGGSYIRLPDGTLQREEEA